MTQLNPADVEGTELDDRDARALTESMVVLPEGGDIFTVVGENGGGEYQVDARKDRCTCPDHTYREVQCKHIRRVAFATGERAIPAWVDTSAVDPVLGEHVDATPQAAATDGGVVERDSSAERAGERARVPVAGGVLVYESRGVGRELVGFESVDDWDALAEGLAARGHDRGAVFHLPELD